MKQKEISSFRVQTLWTRQRDRRKLLKTKNITGQRLRRKQRFRHPTTDDKRRIVKLEKTFTEWPRSKPQLIAELLSRGYTEAKCGYCFVASTKNTWQRRKTFRSHGTSLIDQINCAHERRPKNEEDQHDNSILIKFTSAQTIVFYSIYTGDRDRYSRLSQIAKSLLVTQT